MEEQLSPCPFSSRYRIPAGQAWRSLAVFLLYRLGLGAALVFLVLLDRQDVWLGVHQTSLFILASLLYLASALVGILLLRLRRPGFAMQSQGQILADIALIPTMLYACGGTESGLGILLALSVAAGGILTGGICAIGLAALATLAVLGQEVLLGLGQFHSTASTTSAGLLGTAFFAIATLAMELSRRAEQHQRLAERHSLDLANLQQLNAFIVEHLQSGILVVDEDGVIRLSNPAARRLMGIAGEPAPRLAQTCPKLWRPFQRWRDGGESACNIAAEEGYPVHVQFACLGHPKPLARMIFLEDHAVYNQRVQQGKLASLGRLTASIAHEIRNPLSAIRHAGQLLSESPALDVQDRRLVQIVLDHSGRVNTVVENILQISRRRDSQRECILLKPWLERFLDDFAAEHQLPGSLFALELGNSEAKALIDPSHLKQILENLLSNALKYGKAETGGLGIRVHNPDRQVKPCIEVRDAGGGIDPQTAQHMFEPFFTTSRSGTGLGLYIARELAELNQACIEYLPEGGGSCFRVCLENGDKLAVEL